MPNSRNEELLKVVIVSKKGCRCASDACQREFKIGDEVLELPTRNPRQKPESWFFCHGGCFGNWND